MSSKPYSADAVGRRIAALRHAEGLSQDKFAESIGSKKGEVGAWESGGRKPSIAKAQPMIRRYGITLDWLFLGDPAHMPHDLMTRIIALRSEDAPQD